MLSIKNHFSILGVLLALGACDDYQTTSLDNPSAERQFRSRSGALVSETAMSDALDRVTREVALALADPVVRSLVFDALHASPYREHKLHFDTFLRANGAALVAKMAQARGQGAAVTNVLETLSEIRDLEFYMPVKEHFTKWDGGSDLIVVNTLEDDGRLPTAFNLRGEEVVIASAEIPPETPALVLVQVETDFSSPPPSPEGESVPMHLSGTGEDLKTTITTKGVVMTYANILDDKEGWPLGDPEFEIHVVTKTGIFNHVSCSGASRTGDYYYDQNGQTWSDEVLAIDSVTLGLREVDFMIFEDDSDPCSNGGGGLKPKLGSTNYAAIIAAVRSGNEVRKDIINDEKVNIFDLAALALGAMGYINSATEDDWVGTANGPVDGCWAPGGPVRFDLEDGAYNGGIDLDFRYGKQRIPTCVMTVTLNGPTEVMQVGSSGNPTPLYTATVVHGSPGVSYEWRDNGVLKTTAASYTMSPVSVGTHTIQVKVTRDNDTQVVTKSKTVTVSEEGGGCPPEGC